MVERKVKAEIYENFYAEKDEDSSPLISDQNSEYKGNWGLDQLRGADSQNNQENQLEDPFVKETLEDYDNIENQPQNIQTKGNRKKNNSKKLQKENTINTTSFSSWKNELEKILQ